jgi:HlyD family secretion protein
VMAPVRPFAAMVLSGALCALPACGRGSGGYVFSGTLQAPTAGVGSTLGGRVTAVRVADGQAVRRGDVLIRLDDAQPRGEVTNAAGRLAQARASLADLEAGARAEDLARAAALADQQLAAYRSAELSTPRQVAVLRAQLRQAQAQAQDAAASAKQAEADASRTLRLYATGDESAQARDAAVARAQRAEAQLRSAQAAIRAARDQLANASNVTLPANAAAAFAGYLAAKQSYRSLAAGPRPDQLRAARAAVHAAEGDLAKARARLAETIVRAPAPGVITAFDLHVGDLVGPGAAVATLDEGGEPFVRIYVPQALLGRVRVGTTLPVRPDADPAARISGTVEQVDAQAQFTPQSVQTASDRATLSFGVKVRVHDAQRRLHGGTTVEVILQ